MIRTHVVVALVMILFGNMSFAQPHLYVNTVVMVTSDGNITLSDGKITFKDYVFKVESEEKKNIWSLVDRDAGVHAILDVRDDRSVYFFRRGRKPTLVFCCGVCAETGFVFLKPPP